jgi:arginase
MSGSIVVVGAPTALGGHFAGMERTPGELRAAGLLDRLAGEPALAGMELRDAGDVLIEPGWRADADPRAKNRALIADMLPRLATHVSDALAGGSDTRLLALGGDCTAHAGVLAGLRRARPGSRLALAWFDAHGDFNTPATTPSGNVWGMPLAMACGYGDADLLAACDAPTVLEEDAALLGGQVLDETESRRLAASRIAHFGAGMLGTAAGQAALEAWVRVVGARVDGLYVAFDLDALDAGGGWSVAMPEPGGLGLETAIAAIAILARGARVVGFGTTAVLFPEASATGPTVDAVARLAAAALGPRGGPSVSRA